MAKGLIDIIVVYKIDRLTRSLADFAKLTEVLDKHEVSFVAVTQQFNTSTSMGRLTLNVLLSFAQFEREVAGERITCSSQRYCLRFQWEPTSTYPFLQAWPQLPVLCICPENTECKVLPRGSPHSGCRS